MVAINGNILGTGYAGGSVNGQPFAGGTRDIILMDYSSAGVVLSTRMTGSSGNDYGYGVACVNSGAAYIAGYTTGLLNGNTNKGVSDVCLVQHKDLTTNRPSVQPSANPSVILSVQPSANPSGIYLFNHLLILLWFHLFNHLLILL